MVKELYADTLQVAGGGGGAVHLVVVGHNIDVLSLVWTWHKEKSTANRLPGCQESKVNIVGAINITFQKHR